MTIALAAEIRNWFIVVVALLGGFITLRTYLATQYQRRLENSFRLIDYFKTEVDKSLEDWKIVYLGSFPERGAEEGRLLIYRNGKTENREIAELFSEGAPDNFATTKLAGIFNLVCEQALRRAIDLRVIYYEYGQIMNSVYSWLHQVKAVGSDGKSLAEEYSPSLHKVYASGKIKSAWTLKSHASIE